MPASWATPTVALPRRTKQRGANGAKGSKSTLSHAAASQDQVSQAHLASRILARERAALQLAPDEPSRGVRPQAPESPTMHHHQTSRPAKRAGSAVPDEEDWHTAAFNAAHSEHTEVHLPHAGRRQEDLWPIDESSANFHSSREDLPSWLNETHSLPFPQQASAEPQTHPNPSSSISPSSSYLQQPSLLADQQRQQQHHSLSAPSQSSPPWLQDAPVQPTRSSQRPAYHHQQDNMAGVLGGEPSTAASRLHGRRGNMSGLMAGLSDEQALHAQQQRQKLLQDLEIQVQQKRAERAARAAAERAADEREERKAREGHAQLVAQAMGLSSSAKAGPVGDSARGPLAAESSQERVLGPGGPLPPPTRTQSNIGRISDLEKSMVVAINRDAARQAAPVNHVHAPLPPFMQQEPLMGGPEVTRPPELATEQLLRRLQEEQTELRSQMEQQTTLLRALQSGPAREQLPEARKGNPHQFSQQQMDAIRAMRDDCPSISLRADSALVPASLGHIPDDLNGFDLRHHEDTQANKAKAKQQSRGQSTGIAAGMNKNQRKVAGRAANGTNKHQRQSRAALAAPPRPIGPRWH